MARWLLYIETTPIANDPSTDGSGMDHAQRPFKGRRAALIAGGLLVTLAVASWAQVPEGWRRGMQYQREMVPVNRGSFMFCRLVYDRVRSEPDGMGWSTDYPMADRNLSIRLAEFTNLDVNRYDDGDPGHALVRATDPELFRCPFLFASDVGTAGFSPGEAAGLGEYLRKGGFLWADDFWGNRAMSHWLGQMEIVLPGYQRILIDADHPLLSSFYFIDEIPQIAHIQFWRRSGGRTSERGAESAVPTMSALVDPNGRIAVLMTHNTDIADGWEREGEEYDFFSRFSPPAYAVGVNVAIYSMTR